MVSRDELLDEIRRVAGEIGRTPGMGVFRDRTKITKHEWQEHFVTWGEAVRSAGLSPNLLQQKTDVETFLLQLAQVTKKLGRMPTQVHWRHEQRQNPELCSKGTFETLLGNKDGRLRALRAWVEVHDEYRDVLPLIESEITPNRRESRPGVSVRQMKTVKGVVYLKRFGRTGYKIGKSANPESRYRQLSSGTLEPVKHVHEIATDDPDGIERYWH